MVVRARACPVMFDRAGSSPGAPHRGGGLPPSKPGPVAGTHDLTELYGICAQIGSFCPSREQWPAASRFSGGGFLGPNGQVHHPLEQLSQAIVRVDPECTIESDPGQRTVATPPGEGRQQGQG